MESGPPPYHIKYNLWCYVAVLSSDKLEHKLTSLAWLDN